MPGRTVLGHAAGHLFLDLPGDFRHVDADDNLAEIVEKGANKSFFRHDVEVFLNRQITGLQSAQKRAGEKFADPLFFDAVFDKILKQGNAGGKIANRVKPDDGHGPGDGIDRTAEGIEGGIDHLQYFVGKGVILKDNLGKLVARALAAVGQGNQLLDIMGHGREFAHVHFCKYFSKFSA